MTILIIRKLILFLVILAISFIAIGLLFAAEEVDLDRIVVTPTRYEEEIRKTSAAVTIITQSEIKNSNAKTIPDVLKTHSGIDIKDCYGNGTKVLVDIRGFGEMAPQNTLVLVDGRRVNEIDLSGVDWTQIPLENIERIEVVKGKGAVIYGDNASSGVINIITKSGRGKTSFEFETKTGSYDLEKQRLSMSGSSQKLSYFLNTSREFTNGYRDNSDLDSQDFSAKLKVNATDLINFGISGSYHDADYGLPGALRESQLLTRNRRETMFPLDTAGEKDWYIAFETQFEPTEEISLKSPLSFRRRRLDNQLLSSKVIEVRKIDTLGFTPSVTVENSLYGKNSKLIAGYDYYRTDSINDAYSFYGLLYYEGAKTRATDIDKNNYAFYAQEQLDISERLSLNAGYRYEKARYSFLSLPQDGPWTSDLFWASTAVDSALTVKKKAADLGLSYNYKEDSNIFIDYSQNFRLPTTDEYYSIWASPPVNINLKPQTADTYTVGINHAFTEQLKAKFSAFTMSVKNELIYDPLTYTNTNYDKTEHRGIESEIEFKPIEKLTFSAGYTLTEAFFEGGAYNNNQIPMVPRHKIFTSASFSPGANWRIDTTARYISKQYFINDQVHLYSPLKEFVTLDSKLSYNLKNASFYIGVNNLFDERYSEFGAISTVYNEKGYYPAPGRNFFIGASLKF